MSLKKSAGNMYEWVTGTWNPLAGECPHRCIYCSTKSLRWLAIREKYSGALHLNEKAMSKNLGRGNTWFVCAQNDLFAMEVLDTFVGKILEYCRGFRQNTYVFQTKNPANYLQWLSLMPPNYIIGCTIETNRNIPKISKAPRPAERARAMNCLTGQRRFLTLEPIMDFDVDILADWIRRIRPEFVNVGADSHKSGLLEPSAIKIRDLILLIQGCGIEVRQKSNLGRLLK